MNHPHSPIHTVVATPGRSTASSLYRLDPPIIGDDGIAHEYGAAMIAPSGMIGDMYEAPPERHG